MPFGVILPCQEVTSSQGASRSGCLRRPENRGMQNNFDGLRLIAALTVLWGHQYLLLGLTEPRIAHVRSPMHLAVLVFFSMSGYLVASSWQSDPHAGRFMLRRLLRIWPGWATCVVILGAGALIAARDAMDTLAAQFWFTNLFFYGFDWEFFKSTHRHALNGSLWTIRFEVQCYVLLATVGLAARRLIKWAAVGAFVALLSAFVALGGERAIIEGLRSWGNFPHLPYFGAFFVAGSLL